MPIPISRAAFLKGLIGSAAALLSGKLIYDWLQPALPEIPCKMLGPSMLAGHRLRDGKIVDLKRTEKLSCKIAIVGGGIAGLSAAWWLNRNGFFDFKIFELEKQVGGNSVSGRNDCSPYPWGAHYVPLANVESEYVRMLFSELGVIESLEQEPPTYNELYLCHEPEERLLKDGRFQSGLIPERGLQAEDRAEIKRFFEEIQRLREATGSDGKPAFAIPLDLSSSDPEYLRLDKISMAEWLDLNGFKSQPLLWYVNYCCRDDYGATPDNVSAWAGLHYYAGRRGRASNAEQNSVVTWPEGNDFIVDRLRESLGDRIISNTLITRVASDDAHIRALFENADPAAGENRQQSGEVHCQSLIMSVPRFVARRILSNEQSSVKVDELVYPPWMVANIALKKVPKARGISVAWDNVSYRSDSLGYVVATHQNITTRRGETVITYYYPLSDREPREGRQLLLSSSKEYWSKLIVDDLEKMHPGITGEMLSIELWPWGHGMISPKVGFIWGEDRKRMKEPAGQGENIFFAHSDMSGISNFEEAQYQGVLAARQALARLRHPV